MPEYLIILLAGIFLPLFPASMLLNAVLDRVQYSWLRALVMLFWPLPGLLIVSSIEHDVPVWVLAVALATSLVYALRMLTLREVNQWTGFLATSLWSLLWLPAAQGVQADLLYWFALGMSAPLVLLVLLAAGLEKRFGAAYTGLYGGLARTIPRFSGILVTVVIAAIATPLFPTFFIMLDMIVETVSGSPVFTIVLLLIWLLWSWAGARLIQGLIVGRSSKNSIADMEPGEVGFYSIILLTLMIGGIYLGGIIL